MTYISDDILKLQEIHKKLHAVEKKRTEEQEPISAKERAKRLPKLTDLLEKLQRGENVQNRQLECWLTDDEYSSYQQDRKSQKEQRADLKDKPLEVVEYDGLLKKAIAVENRANAGTRRGKKSDLSSRAQALFEKALEYLHENLTSNPYLQLWFDRSVDFDPENYPSLDSISMPRAVTTRSAENLGGGLLMARMTNMEVKIGAIESAIEKLK
jgi:hypothetical protein